MKVYLSTETIKLCNGFEVEWFRKCGVTTPKQLNDVFLLYKFCTFWVYIWADQDPVAIEDLSRFLASDVTVPLFPPYT